MAGVQSNNDDNAEVVNVVLIEAADSFMMIVVLVTGAAIIFKCNNVAKLNCLILFMGCAAHALPLQTQVGFFQLKIFWQVSHWCRIDAF
jgi:uracil DNA glycosylase